MKRGPRKKTGRKPLFKPKLGKIALNLYAEGKTDAQAAKILAMNPRTLKMWRVSMPEYAEAVRAAKDLADLPVEVSLYRRATGYYYEEEKSYYNKGKLQRFVVEKFLPPDPTSMIFWLKNRNPAKWRDINVTQTIGSTPEGDKVSFEEFCRRADYPVPYPKQDEMRVFAFTEAQPRMIMGSRGYGKTDYVTVMGSAYQLYLDRNYRILIVSKSDERNAAMLDEIAKACEANGVIFEKRNASCLRVGGVIGKEHSVSTITIGSNSVRGRHPNLIIMDDPVTEEDVSEATRKKVQRLYNELNKLCSNIVLIGQPVHRSDLYMTLDPLITSMKVPYGSIPELDVDLEAMKLAGVSEQSISASYHLKILANDFSPFENISFIDNFPKSDSVAFIDPSFEGGDYTALSIMTGHFDGVAVFGKVWKKAWNHCAEEIVEALVKNGVKKLCFETNALGDQPVVMLRGMVPAGIGVVGKKSTGYKHSRIMNAGAYAKSIHLAKNSDRLYIEQVTQYEYGAKNDDAPDSLASLLEWVGLIRGKKV